MHVARHADSTTIDSQFSPTFALGDALEVYVRRKDAERFIEEVRGDEPELVRRLRIAERDLEAGGRNLLSDTP